MSTVVDTARINRLLADLPADELQRFRSSAEEVRLDRGATIFDPRAAIQHVYFPLTGFLSSILPTEDGSPEVEISSVGFEGMVGTALVLGVSFGLERVLVQSDGTALRLTSANFERLMNSGSALNVIIRKYMFVVAGNVAQNVACAHHHLLEARFARWLLAASDRVRSSEFFLTQEFIGNMLGVHRPAVSEAVRLMQQRGLITHTRGRIHVIDRREMESVAYPCYELQRKLYESILGKDGRVSRSGDSAATLLVSH